VGEVGIVGLDARRHVGELDQLDPDQALGAAQVFAQHRHGAPAAGVQQHPRALRDQAVDMLLEQAVRVRHAAVEAVEQAMGKCGHGGFLGRG
jgi:hypothetical protein